MGKVFTEREQAVEYLKAAIKTDRVIVVLSVAIIVLEKFNVEIQKVNMGPFELSSLDKGALIGALAWVMIWLTVWWAYCAIEFGIYANNQPASARATKAIKGRLMRVIPIALVEMIVKNVLFFYAVYLAFPYLTVPIKKAFS